MIIGTARESYRADEALLKTRPQQVWMGILLAGLCALPFVFNTYWTYLACLVLINVIAATGLNVLTDPIWSDTAGPFGVGPRLSLVRS